MVIYVAAWRYNAVAPTGRIAVLDVPRHHSPLCADVFGKSCKKENDDDKEADSHWGGGQHSIDDMNTCLQLLTREVGQEHEARDRTLYNT